MNEIKISGTFDRAPELTNIDRPTGSTDLAKASLNFYSKRGDKDVKMWVDIEAVGKKAFELADVPLNVEVTVTGRLERAAWQDKTSGDWKSKHFVRYTDSEYAAGDTPSDDIPF